MRTFYVISFCLCVWLCVITDAADPSDFLVRKWKARFHAIDVNHDSVLSGYDGKLMSKTYTELHQIAEDQITDTRKALRTWWTNCVQGPVGTTMHFSLFGLLVLLSKDQTYPEYMITEWLFVEAYTQYYSTDPEGFKNTTITCYTTIFEIFDHDKDEAISREEFQIFTKSFGHTNEDADEALFQAFNPTDGKVPIADIKAFFVGLICSEEDRLVFDAIEDGA